MVPTNPFFVSQYTDKYTLQSTQLSQSFSEFGFIADLDSQIFHNINVNNSTCDARKWNLPNVFIQFQLSESCKTFYGSFLFLRTQIWSQANLVSNLFRYADRKKYSNCSTFENLNYPNINPMKSKKYFIQLNFILQP